MASKCVHQRLRNQAAGGLVRKFSSIRLSSGFLQAPRNHDTALARFLHATPTYLLPRKRDFFTANSNLEPESEASANAIQSERKRATRAPASKTSLRKVAVEAQRSRDGVLLKQDRQPYPYGPTKMITAYCAAEQFNIRTVIKLLQQDGYILDPYGTGLLPQVVHVQVPVGLGSMGTSTVFNAEQPDTYGDVFIFPSGTVVAWSLPERVALRLVRETLLPAAENPHIDLVETEDLEYVENKEKDTSTITGDVIMLGTKLQARFEGETEALQLERAKVDTTLAKIAFSSGLARSTNLAVLETLLSKYFDSTRTIPALLSRGGRLPFSRSFVLQKTGQLLSVRAQLNLYSELTDSLPDVFWDSRHDLGLEGYYDQVGRALDVNVRIRILNEKMDYAQELVSVLRETKSEKHGLTLEWMIIALITIEVGFEVLRLYKEHREKVQVDSSVWKDR